MELDIMQLFSTYMDKRDPDEIWSWYTRVDISSVTNNYEALNLLHVASRNAHSEAIDYLLERGMNPNDEAGNGETAIFMLAKKSHTGGWKPREGDIYKSACLLLDARAGTLRKDSRDKLCYHYAAERGNYEFLQALLDKGVKLTKADGDGNTGLHLIVEATYNPLRDLEGAKARGFAEQIRDCETKLENLFRAAAVLMQAGVDVDAKNNLLETAHKVAIRRGAKKIAALLDGSYIPGDDSAEAEQKLKAGGMTLHQAVRFRDAEAIKAIVQSGADINEVNDAEDFSGMTPLAVACSTCDAEMVEILLALGADPTVKNGNGSSAAAWLFSPITNLRNLQEAASNKTPVKILRLVVQHGFDINSAVTDRGETLLALACRLGRGSGRDSVLYMVVNEALRQRADTDIANLDGQTPLMLACGGDFSDMEEIGVMFLEAGADASLKDNYGNTALHYAAYNSSPRGAFTLAEMLFDVAQPDANAVNNDGKTPLDYAVERNNEQLVKLLLEHA